MASPPPAAVPVPTGALPDPPSLHLSPQCASTPTSASSTPPSTSARWPWRTPSEYRLLGDIARGPGDLRGALGDSCHNAAPSKQWDVAFSEQVLVGGARRWRPFFRWHLGGRHPLCPPTPAGDELQAEAGTEMSAALGLELGWRCSPGWDWDGDGWAGSGGGVEVSGLCLELG